MGNLQRVGGGRTLWVVEIRQPAVTCAGQTLPAAAVFGGHLRLWSWGITCGFRIWAYVREECERWAHPLTCSRLVYREGEWS